MPAVSKPQLPNWGLRAAEALAAPSAACGDALGAFGAGGCAAQATEQASAARQIRNLLEETTAMPIALERFVASG